MKKPEKYFLYEQSVQSPVEDVELFMTMYRNSRHREPRHLREDFCGTYQHACEWVKRDKRNTAVGLDLDPEPLAYGKRNHYARLSADQKRRLKIFKKDVRSVTSPKADLIIANNFSFFIFKQRKDLLEYFRACRKSLGSKGVLIVEMAGGPGMVEKNKEQRTIKVTGKTRFKYVWDQKKFNPITRDGLYSIHFFFEDGRAMKDAFVYDWRIWTIPEVRDVMRDAGFRDTHVYWEKTVRGVDTGEYIRTDKGDNCWSWLAYVAGLR